MHLQIWGIFLNVHVSIKHRNNSVWGGIIHMNYLYWDIFMIKHL